MLDTDPPSSFRAALTLTLAHEGTAYTDDPRDPGGATHYGITLRSAQAAPQALGFSAGHTVTVADIKALTEAQAAGYYAAAYWDRYGYGRLSPMIAAKVFDLAVNMGPSQAHKLLQRALGAIGAAVPVDGMFGPRSLAAANAASPDRLLAALRTEAADFYRALVAERPSLQPYLHGWLTRAAS